MPALAANTIRTGKQPGPVKSFPVGAAVRIFAGSAVMINAAGFAVPALAAAGNAGCAGCAVEEANNTSGANGAMNVRVQPGLFLLPALSITQAMVGTTMFLQSDNQFDDVQGANEPVGGVLEEFVSTTSGWVRIGPLQVTRAIAS